MKLWSDLFYFVFLLMKYAQGNASENFDIVMLAKNAGIMHEGQVCTYLSVR